MKEVTKVDAKFRGHTALYEALSEESKDEIRRKMAELQVQYPKIKASDAPTAPLMQQEDYNKELDDYIKKQDFFHYLPDKAIYLVR